MVPLSYLFFSKKGYDSISIKIYYHNYQHGKELNNLGVSK